MSEEGGGGEAPATASPDQEAKGGGFKGGRQRGPKTCYNCGQSGHIARECTNPRLEGEDRNVIRKAKEAYRRCFNCGKMGHISADCPKPAGNKACYNCGQEGHIARDCPKPRESS